jgi:hypothetical protein
MSTRIRNLWAPLQRESQFAIMVRIIPLNLRRIYGVIAALCRLTRLVGDRAVITGSFFLLNAPIRCQRPFSPSRLVVSTFRRSTKGGTSPGPGSSMSTNHDRVFHCRLLPKLIFSPWPQNERLERSVQKLSQRLISLGLRLNDWNV